MSGAVCVLEEVEYCNQIIDCEFLTCRNRPNNITLQQ